MNALTRETRWCGEKLGNGSVKPFLSQHHSESARHLGRVPHFAFGTVLCRKVGTLIEWKMTVELGPSPMTMSRPAATDQALMAYFAMETGNEEGPDPILEAEADELTALLV